MEMSLRRTHFERLRQHVPETVATSEIHLDLMDMLKRINSHATGIARIILEWDQTAGSKKNAGEEKRSDELDKKSDSRNASEKQSTA